jgi:hypothetical protein
MYVCTYQRFRFPVDECVTGVEELLLDDGLGVADLHALAGADLCGCVGVGVCVCVWMSL